MKLKRYSEYKDSGVQWLGNSPEHWEVRRLSYFFAERREKVSDKDYRALSVTKKGVVPQLDNAAKTDDGDNRKLVLAGDFVINSRSDRKGSSGLSDLDGSVSLINTVLKPYCNIYGRFAHHLFRSYLFQEEYYKYGKGIVADLWNTNYSEMRNISLAVPNNDEQLSIANFLDHETAKLDNLIAKQEMLIELLQEKRQAIISNAVTRGLEPNVKMKDSGVEWLGEVPESWEVKKIKHTSYLKGRVGWKGLTSDEYLESGYAYLVTGTDFKTKYIDWESCHCVEKFRYEDDPYIQLKDGDLLITKDGTIGKLALVKNLNGLACLNSGIFLVRPLNAYITSYMYWVLNSRAFSEFYKLTSVGSTIQHLYQNVFENFSFPVPKIECQKKIVLHIEETTNKLDSIIEKAKQSIELAKEHRIALISAAVTGKIDVRDFKEIA